MRTVAVLCCLPRSEYHRLPGVEAFDESRDAFTYQGGSPVVCHPPCAQWGRLRSLAHPNERHKALGPFCVAQVRQWGGVLEHPAASTLFSVCGLPSPCSGCDEYGGFTIELNQSWFGYEAAKRTWIYMVGVPREKLVYRINLSPPTHVVDAICAVNLASIFFHESADIPSVPVTDLYTAEFTTEARRRGAESELIPRAAVSHGSDSGGEPERPVGLPAGAECRSLPESTAREFLGDGQAIPDSPSVPPCLRGEPSGHQLPATSHQSDCDPNAELQTIPQSQAVVEACPFDATYSHNPTLPPPEPPAPLPVRSYIRPERLEAHNNSRGPRAEDHHRRHEWSPEWRISPAGFSAGLHSDGTARTLYVAYHDDRSGPPEGITEAKFTGPEWRFFIDLDRGVYRDWTGQGEWRPVADGLWPIASAATELELKHEDNHIRPRETDTEPAARVVRDGAADVASLHSPTDVELSIQRRTPGLGADDGPDYQASQTDRLPGPPWTPDVDPACHRPSTIRLCQPGQYPEPGDWMSPDERQGWRRLWAEGRVIYRQGPDCEAEALLYATWRNSLNCYFSGSEA